MKHTNPKLVLTAGLLFALLGASEAQAKKCGWATAEGTDCKNLKVTFDAKACPEVTQAKNVEIQCHGADDAVASVKSDKYVYRAKIKRYVGQTGNVVWQAETEIERTKTRSIASVSSPADIEEHPEPKKPVSAPAAVVTAPAPVVAAPVTSPPTPVVAPVPNLGKIVESSAVPVPTPIRLDALLQLWTVDEPGISKTNFRIRRAEVKFSGNASEKTRWYLAVDPAKSPSTTSTTVVTATTPTTKTTKIAAVNTSGDNKILQDIGLGHNLGSGFELLVGQFKIQTTSESLEPSAELLLPERSYIARAYGDRREPGAALIYKNDAVRMSAMLSNGQAQNVDDTDRNKNLSARFDYKLSPKFRFGLFTQATNFAYEQTGSTGLNVRLNLGDFMFKAEGVRARTVGVDTAGWVAEVSMSDRLIGLAPIVRYENFSPNFDGTAHATATTVGFGWAITGSKEKIEADYTFLENLTSNGGTPSYLDGAKSGAFVLQFQVTQ